MLLEHLAVFPMRQIVKDPLLDETFTLVKVHANAG
jgi:hypothetical protein